MLLKELVDILNCGEIFIELVTNDGDYRIDYLEINDNIKRVLNKTIVREALIEDAVTIYVDFKGTTEKPMEYQFTYSIEAYSKEEADFLMFEKTGQLREYELE